MIRKRMNYLAILLALAVVSYQMKSYASGNMAESTVENITESVVENTQEKDTESTSETSAENAPETATETTPETDAETVPETAAETTSERTTETAPEKAPESTAEASPENSPKNVTVPTASSELISVVLPVIEERDPFNFFIDPLHIFYNTFGNSGGDITVEEDTCLLFYHHDESAYTLSSRSDSLEIMNKSTVPVEVTITAKLENADGITVMQDKEFTGRDSCDLYLALVDNEGNVQPLSEDGEVSIAVYLDRAPLDAYAYVLNEDTGEYQYACRSEEIAFDTYSFGLMGACNENGDWVNISARPHVTISWNVEPVVPEESESGETPEEKSEDISGGSVSDDDVAADDGQNSGEQAVDGNKDSTNEQSVDGNGNSTGEQAADGNGDSTGEQSVDGNGDSTGKQAADGNGDSTENAASAGDSDIDTEAPASEKDTSAEKGSTEESGPDTDSSDIDEADGETASDENNPNESGQATGGNGNPTEDAAGDTEGPASQNTVPDAGI